VLDPLRLFAHLHGHMGWLAAAVLIHPAIVLKRRVKADFAVGLALAFVTVAGGMGAWLYPAYREKIKQSIFIQDPRIGLLFERKEHLAFGAIALAWVGAIAYVAARGQVLNENPAMRDSLRRASHVAFVAAAALAVVVAALGTVVATFKGF
jgi:alpha-beta hydrolase superfamily lysophospholipase